ncbi:acetolactate synthase-1/2/3 large subunit [Singulisphaera sp. GP187]|uniref:thiamine pyrophosphate-binding protein n=1 Tax=Singulisphaera sp. GP187 TaxID=1882752 RepID=UPI00092AF82D|nr:thiamine pyrophosphate-binding protein [Singulisphaera sp. GP187]SIO55170.1 acetolactate synthase-1/2/3 large subunit [Singulisphaera sp. GP187]
MFLNNAFGTEQRLKYTCNHHEQASAIAAEGYARVAERVGVLNVTTGPGSINALNGVFGAWTDSIPMLIVSGQVKRETCMASYDLPALRQLGDQEVDIVRMVGGITKYAVLVTDPQSIRYHLERALYLAEAGRPGPCWIDVPVDVQSSMIDPESLPGYDPAEDDPHWDRDAIRAQCREVIERISRAERPVILAGTGVRLAHAIDKFQEVARRLGIPVTTAWTHDLIAWDDPLYCGRQGSIGDRAGNFTVQNSDCLLILGARLPIRQISYNWKAFARHAYKIQVDVDAAELDKPTVKPDLPIHSDAAVFLEELGCELAASGHDAANHAAWLEWCKERVRKYPVVLPKHREFQGAINPYHFIEVLFEHLADDDVVACGDATACIVPFQAAKLKLGQRLFSNSGSASMGFDLPAAIGAAVAREGKRVICLAGDGSIQMNVQELQTVVHNRLPIKIFVLSNGGYLSIRTTQKNFFGNLVGEGPTSGVSFPDMSKLAAAYGIPSLKIDGPDFAAQIDQALEGDGPFLCEVVLDQAQTFEPRLSSRQLPDGRIVTAPPEDMFPFLDREEFLSNLLIPAAES